MCGLMMKSKWCSWLALYCSCVSFANSRKADDAKQVRTEFHYGSLTLQLITSCIISDYVLVHVEHQFSGHVLPAESDTINSSLGCTVLVELSYSPNLHQVIPLVGSMSSRDCIPFPFFYILAIPLETLISKSKDTV